MLRFAIANVIARRWGVQFPLGTLVVNSSAALLIGLLAAWLDTMPEQSQAGSIIAIGLLGSYSTVSSFSLQTLILWQSHYYRQALLNIGLSFGFCCSLVFTGFMLGNQWW